MLEALRTFVGSWAAKILLVVLVGSFALWGVSGTILTAGNSTSVATVGESTVSVSEYLSSYNRNLTNASRLAGRQLTQQQAEALFNIQQRALQDTVTAATLDEYSRTLNMSLSQDTLARMIAENPAFQSSNGTFSRQRFQDAVRNAGIRERDFVISQNGNAIRSQIMEAVAAGSVLPSAFTEALADYAGEKRKFRYITITSEIAGNPPAPTDADLKTYFEANLKHYSAPEYRKLTILALEPKDIADEAGISDEAVKEDYEKRKGAYTIKEQRRVHQIVLSLEKAKTGLETLKNGGSFDELLAANNVKPEDADLGMVEKHKLPKALQEAAFALPLNGVSEIVKGPFGSTLLQVTEIKPESVRPLSEVATEIRKELALHLASDRTITLQTEIEDIRAGGATLKEAAEQQGLELRVVDAIDRTARDPKGNIISDLPNSRELLAEAFKSEIGEQTSPLNLNTIGTLWFEVTDITPARDRTLDEVRERVATDWTAVETSKLAATKAEELLARMKKGATLQDISIETGASLFETELLKRGGSEQTFPAAAVNAGFAGDKDTVALANGPQGGSKILLQVSGIDREEAKINDAVKQEAERANNGAANDVLEQLITKLQSQYTVTQNPELMRQALARR